MSTRCRWARRGPLAAVLGTLLCLPMLGGSAAPPLPAYIVEDAGINLPQFGGLFRPGINSLGQVVAAGPYSVTAAPRSAGLRLRGPRVTGLPPFQAVRTDAALTTVQNLGTLGGSMSNALGVNRNPVLNSSQVVGWSVEGEGMTRAFRFTDGVGMQDLGTLGGAHSLARSINSAGQIAGESESGRGPIHAFRYDPTAMPPMQDLGVPPQGISSSGWGINEAGMVVGEAEIGAGIVFRTHAFLYADGIGMQDLGTFPDGDESRAYDINNQSPFKIVGEAETVQSETIVNHAMLYTSSGGMVDLGTLSGDLESLAWAVNDQGVVVGRSSPDDASYNDHQAFAWTDLDDSGTSEPGEMVNLNNLIPEGSGWSLVEATDINNSGQIVGIGFRMGVMRVFRLTPADSSPPVLANCSVTPASRNAAGGNFTLSVEATDNEGVQTVVAEVTRPDMTVVNVSLVQQETTNTYSGVFTAPANTGASPESYQVEFRATDTSSNESTMPCEPFVVNPNERPIIVSCSVAPPSRPPSGGQFTVTVEVTDDLGVSGVVAEIAGPNNIPDVNLTLQSGTATNGVYTGVFNAPANGTMTPQNYDVTAEATDTRGATDSEDCGTVTVLAITDPTPPQIHECEVTPIFLPRQGGLITISARATDNEGIDEVRALITTPGDGVVPVPLPNIGGDLYRGTYVVPANPQSSAVFYSPVVEAEDGAGNTDTDTCEEVRVAASSETGPLGMQVTPKKLDYGKVKLGKKPRKSFTIRNQGPASSSVLAFRLGSVRTPFRIVSAVGAQGKSPSGVFTLGAGGKLKVTVEFAPTEVGCFEDDILIRTNDEDRPNVTVHCIGMGCKAK